MRRLSQVLGALRILRNRAPAVGQPGLTVWIDSGARAAQAAAAEAAALAHANECDELDVAGRLEKITADGVVDAVELRDLLRLPVRLKRCAARSHEIGEVAS